MIYFLTKKKKKKDHLQDKRPYHDQNLPEQSHKDVVI